MDIQKTGPWRITFDTNPDDCNLSCIMCEDHSPYSTTQRDRIRVGLPKRRMKIELIEKIIREAQGSPLKEIIPSTMGEPLVYKDFDRIIELCHQYHVRLNLTTNGTFPIKGVSTWAKLLVPITTDVKISWNGATKATQEKIMLGTKWEKVLENLKTFISVRDEYAQSHNHYCTVTLQLTFLENNIHELADIVKLGIELGVDRIKGHHLWAHFDEIKDLSMRRDPDSIARWNQAVEFAERVQQNNLLPSGKMIKLENIYKLEANAIDDLLSGAVCPFLGKEAWVSPEGRFSPCCAPDKLRQKLGDFGNVNERSLSEIWQAKSYQTLQKNYMQHDVCQHCNMRKIEG
jgi:radical SAM protein with 4Fe4S-binding SPASM domain